MDMLPVEVITALGEGDFGIDPIQMSSSWPLPSRRKNGPPGAVVVLRFAPPVAEDKLHARRGTTRWRASWRQDLPSRRGTDGREHLPRRRPHGARGHRPALAKAVNNHAVRKTGR